MKQFSSHSVACYLILLTIMGCSVGDPPAHPPASPQERARAAFGQGEQLRLSYKHSAAQQALMSYAEALKIWESLHSTADVSTTLRSIGDTHLQLGKPRLALEYFEQSLRGFESLGDQSKQAAVLNEIGRAFKYMGKPNQSFDLHQEALIVARDVNDQYEEAASLLPIARWQSSWGLIEDSLESSEEAIAILRDLGETDRLVSALREAGETYSLLGRMQESLDCLNEALSIREAQGRIRHQVGILTEIGWVHYLLGDTSKAIEIYQRALRLTQADGRQGPAGTLDRLGSAYRQAKRLDEALEAYQQALQLMEEKSPFVKAHTLANLAELYVEWGEPVVALEYCQQAIPLFEKSRDVNALAHTLFVASRAERQTGMLDSARDRLERVLEILDSVRYRVGRQAFLDAFQSVNSPYYQAHVDLLMEMHQERPGKGYDLLALAASERTRAQRLEESWIAAHSGATRAVDLELMRQSRHLQARIEAKDRERIKLIESGKPQGYVQALDQEQQKLLLELDRIQAEMRPRRRSTANPFDVARLQHLLGQNTVLLYYDLGPQRSFLWLLDGSAVQTYRLPAAEEIDTLARSCLRLFNRKQTAPVKLQLHLYLKELGELLLRPVLDQLADKRLIIVPDGAVQYVPFAALEVSSRRLLVQDHVVNLLPSATSLALLANRSESSSPPKSLALFADPVFSFSDPRLAQAPRNGDSMHPSPVATNLDRSANDLGMREFPRLPFTRQEGEAILGFFPVDNRFQAFDFAANRDTLMNLELARYQILHFATHSLLHPRYPELSGIVLSLVDSQGNPRAGFLRAHDIADLRLEAELAVLSACRTGLGKEIPGEGLIGLPQAFLDAGVPAVVVSLWSVSDPATAELMQQFYLGMMHEQLPPPDALRRAQLFMLSKKEWSEPYYWASFVFLGKSG